MVEASSKTTMSSSTLVVIFAIAVLSVDAFLPQTTRYRATTQHVPLSMSNCNNDRGDQLRPLLENMGRMVSTTVASAAVIASLTFGSAAWAENELSDIYGGKGFDSSLVDQTCLVDRCSSQAKACLADDPSCRKGLTCTAKCLGDNACITGCMARYGNKNLDNLLKCTIEDHECIKIAILPGGADKYGEEPRSPAPTVANFNPATMAGTWYKVVGFNPNYDCYACQRNSFEIPQVNDGGDNLISVSSSTPTTTDRLEMKVEFSMPHLLPDGAPPPPRNVRESITVNNDAMFGSKSIGLNEYNTNEVMIFDNVKDPSTNLVVNQGKPNEASYSRTAHSEGEMFGLKFWENWYVIGENDPDQPEFKFIYYNGKTRQNTYEGAFVYSRSRSLEPESMKKVYKIAKDAGMNPDQFCRIRNGCFANQEEPMFVKGLDGSDSSSTLYNTNNNNKEQPSIALRGILASTKVSEFLGVEPVSAEVDMELKGITSRQLQPKMVQETNNPTSRPWWYEVGDYLENPHRHFEAMDKLRQPMNWPEDVKLQ